MLQDFLVEAVQHLQGKHFKPPPSPQRWHTTAPVAGGKILAQIGVEYPAPSLNDLERARDPADRNTTTLGTPSSDRWIGQFFPVKPITKPGEEPQTEPGKEPDKQFDIEQIPLEELRIIGTILFGRR